jgi:dephospho-CoA kinase
VPKPSFLRVALTGGIATGKSTCLDRFEAAGVPVIDADQLARDAVAPGTPGLAAVRARFGHEVITASGSLDRGHLARIVFADAASRADLEAIVHPFVFAGISEWFAQQARSPAEPGFAVADVPLLYETGHQDDFDRVIVVACTPEQQVARLVARDALTEAEARQRLAAQWPIDTKRALADYVIDTSGTREETERQVDAFRP